MPRKDRNHPSHCLIVGKGVRLETRKGVRACARAYGETIVESRTKTLLVCPKLGCVLIGRGRACAGVCVCVEVCA